MTEKYKYQFGTEPYEHQIEALHRAWGRDAYAFFMEMGTGKTKVAIDEMCMLFEMGRISRALVLAPKGVYLNWSLREIPAHMPERIAQRADILHWMPGGGSKTHQRQLETLLSNNDKFQVLIMNIEALSSGVKGLRFAERFLQSGGGTYMVVDESTFIKSGTSARTKNVISLGGHAGYRRIMTGLPTPNSPLDAYSQFEFLGSSLLGFRSYYSFRNRYAVLQDGIATSFDPKTHVMKERKYKVVVAHRNTEELAEKIKRHAYRVTKDECLDLPPKVYSTRDVELTPDQREMYATMRELALSEILDEGDPTDMMAYATIVLTKILRLQQIVCGHITDEDGDVHRVSNNRISEMMRVLEETPGKIVIWATWQPNIEDIVSAVKKEYGDESIAEYHGRNTRVRDSEAQRFLTDDQCNFIVSSQQSGGFGNTWVVPYNVLYYSNTHNLEHRLQSEDRVHRSGQTRSVNYIDLVSRSTVDEVILRALRTKIDLAAVITGDSIRDWVI